MHNCKETKEQITELLLDGAECSPDEALSEELRGCVECHGEFDALSATLRITTRLREAATPTEMYWTSYHAKLRQKLFHAKAQRRRETETLSFAPLRLCARLLQSSVSVPVPLGIATVLAFSILTVFAMRSVRRQSVTPVIPAVVHVPVQVPVVQEKIVTRVVYRERSSRKSQQTIDPIKVDSTFAKSQKLQNEDSPMTLVGFKPTDEIKLTVIKGGSSNEK
jgi:hypothetical protein